MAIRIFIVADFSEQAEAMAALLEEDERFEISEIGLADVIVCVGISVRRLPRRGRPVVAVGTERDGDAPFDETLKAWLPAGAQLKDIAAAVEAAAHGLTVLTDAQARRLFRRTRQTGGGEQEADPLTAREQEVLQMLASGLGNKQIAAQLRISVNTAKFHVAQIMAKLAAGSRTEAVSIAIRRGLVPV